MQLQISINQRLKAEVDIDQVKHALTTLPVTVRIDVINSLVSNISDEDYENLTPGQRRVIQEYCKKQSDKFSKETIA